MYKTLYHFDRMAKITVENFINLSKSIKNNFAYFEKSVSITWFIMKIYY